MKLFSTLVCFLLLAIPGQTAPSSADFSRYLSAERSISRHDRALTELVSTLEEWLAGRQSADATKKKVASLKSELQGKLELSGSVAATVKSSQQRTLSAVEKFLAQSAPDAEGQRALFETLNAATRDRATALLAWRSGQNASLAKAAKGSRATYLAWERRWIEVWKGEVDITYRLQKAFLSTQGGSGAGFVRELLALGAKADKIAASKELDALSGLAKKRLTLLARAAEQLDRVGSGSRGALTRLRKWGKEHAVLTKEMQEQRLVILGKLASGS